MLKRELVFIFVKLPGNANEQFYSDKKNGKIHVCF